jgi:hypothetical protein
MSGREGGGADGGGGGGGTRAPDAATDESAGQRRGGECRRASHRRAKRRRGHDVVVAKAHLTSIGRCSSREEMNRAATTHTTKERTKNSDSNVAGPR